jgi:D-alanyl-lipoteichoic acid acyltransferase DltB (MBOAT superfamily)
LVVTPERNLRPPARLFIFQVVQLGLVLAVAHLFLIEQTYGFDRLIPVIFVGFVLHAWLPAHWRSWLMLLLFPVSAILLLGPIGGVTLITLGVLLFLLCQLPLPVWARAAILLGVGAILAAVRIGYFETSAPKIQMYFQTQTLPILSAMFMFRTAVYLYDLRHEKVRAPLAQRISYFFLFPNVCFPLFPVIDYQTFKRTYFNREQAQIYQKGIDWIFRGIVHLLLYRIVYHYFVPDPFRIHDLADVAQYALSSFLLYLRISGLFHLIVGILCLFGYDLPETHHRYYLAESFTDFWRRINIYWKDFMVKLFYFPMVMSLRRWGTTRAMVVATLATFVITWLLHSYQWFWLRGSFPLHPQDMIFWGILAILVTANSLYEERFGRTRRSLKKDAKPGLWQAVRRSARIVTVFVIICLLWSFWTSVSIDNWLAVMSVAGTASAVEIAVVILTLLAAVAIGAVVQLAGGHDTVGNRSRLVSIPHRAAWIGSAAAVLIAFSFPAVNYSLDRRASSVIATITGDQLNTRDQQQLVKGYYEELLGGESSGSMVWSVRLEEPETWKWNGRPGSDYRVSTNDLRGAELRPHIVAVDKGQLFTTNQWGMRDREYEKIKSPGTLRIAMFGSSYTVGAGVRMEDTFPWLLENRLNSEQNDSSHRKTEILNFAVAGDSILQRVARLQKRALDFDIDAVVDVSVSGDTQLAVRGLRDAVLERVPDLNPELLAIVDKAAINRAMSKDEIERRLGPFAKDILRFGYRELAATTRQNGVKVVVVVLPRLDDTDELYREESARISALATEVGIEAIRLEGVYGTLNDRNSLKLASWDWHPNTQGHALLAARLYEEFQSIDFATTSSRLGDSARPVGNGSLQ